MVFGFIKNTVTKLYTSITNPLKSLFSAPIDAHALSTLETILLKADTGNLTTQAIMNRVKKAVNSGALQEGSQLQSLVKQELFSLLDAHTYAENSSIFLLVGINGSGKTTSAAKLAALMLAQNKKTLLIAADTFRAAATQQLADWATRLQVDIVTGTPGQDPCAVIYKGLQKYKDEKYDSAIIDTAGRLQTKINLMKELEKIRRVISTQLPDKSITTLLTIDAMLGQNSFEQASLFNQSTPIQGVIVTKMDSTAKGGIIFAICKELTIPIAYISHGENPEDFKLFNAQEYIDILIPD